MLPDDDPRWEELTGGYHVPYDPRPAILGLRDEGTRDRSWDELWEELHHQGDVGDASYAAVPLLVATQAAVGDLGWQLYALCSTIETERHRLRNPVMPAWLEGEYAEAWKTLLAMALEELATTSDHLLLRTALSVVAQAKGATKLGSLLAVLDEDEVRELAEERLSWSSLYRPAD